jgi:ABC-type Fe3+-hydroxamate transport system substrate-binding protein
LLASKIARGHPGKWWRWLLCVTSATILGACARGDSGASGAGSRTPALESAAVTDSDDFGARIRLDSLVGTRVVSLVPAATEVIFAMGRGNRLVGRTTWDMYPDSARLIPNVGDGIHPNVEVVLATRPTLVVLYAGADNRSAAAAFKKMGIAVLAIKVDHISDFERLTKQLGQLLDATDRAQQVVDTVQATLSKVRTAVAGAPRPTVVWPMYDTPVLVVGNGSFLGELLGIAGADNTFADLAQPSPEVTIEEIASRNPAVMLASPTLARQLTPSPKWRAVRAVREGQLRLTDTSVTGRPTVTLGMAAVSLARVLHPDRAARLP